MTGLFPSKISSEGFLDDKDREKLKSEKFELAKGTKEKMYEETFYIYKAFSTAEERVFISYSSSDVDSKPLRKSLLISKIKRIFPKLVEETNIQEEESEKEIKLDENKEIFTKNATFSELLNNIDNEKWFEVYEWYNNNEIGKLQNALKGLKYSNIPNKINEKNIEKLYGKNLMTSVSKLETYEACPYSYFLKYGLNINEKEKLEIKSLDTGSFMHDVIDKFFKKIDEYYILKDDSIVKKDEFDVNSDLKYGIDYKNLTIREIKSIEIVRKIVDEIIKEKLQITSKFTQEVAKYKVLLMRLNKVITKSLLYIIESLQESEFEVFGTEIEFGKDEKAKYEPIEIKLDDNKKVSIIGKIDRVDIAKMPDGKYMRIIDYKSSVKDINLNEVIGGLQLQLLTYVDAMCKNEDVLPAGALYFTLFEKKIKDRNAQTEEQIENIIKENYRMNGLVVADVNVIKAMDTNLQDGEKSKIIPVSLTNSGNVDTRTSKTISRKDFELLQNYTMKLIKEISENIYKGDISLKPYYNVAKKNTPCEYCSYKSICQFNTKLKNNKYRIIKNEKKQDILDKLNNM